MPDGARIVNTASDAHSGGALDPAHLDSPGGYRPFTVYGTSKQANILFAAEAARRWPRLLSFSYHPGVVRTNFGSSNFVIGTFFKLWPFLRTPDKGAQTLVWLATTDPSGIRSGGYYQDMREIRPNARATDPNTARMLWESSLTAVGLPAASR